MKVLYPHNGLSRFDTSSSGIALAFIVECDGIAERLDYVSFLVATPSNLKDVDDATKVSSTQTITSLKTLMRLTNFECEGELVIA